MGLFSNRFYSSAKKAWDSAVAGVKGGTDLESEVLDSSVRYSGSGLSNKKSHKFTKEDSGIDLDFASDSGIALDSPDPSLGDPYVYDNSRDSSVDNNEGNTALTVEPKDASLDEYSFGSDEFSFDFVDVEPLQMNDLYSLARDTFDSTGDNLEEDVLGFMRDHVFASDAHVYEGISETVDYLKSLRSADNVKGVGTAITVLKHLDDYVSSSSKEVNGKGFRTYLMGRRGVLTKERLGQMGAATKTLTAKLKDDDFRSGVSENEKFSYRGFDVEYEESSVEGKYLVSLNDKETRGMKTGLGNVYWESIDGMFDSNVSVRKTLKKSMNSCLYKEHKKKNIRRIDAYSGYTKSLAA
ncbi:MAG: hypothetical protein ACI83O_000193 [Patescibacteria group bacterium]|jgi:hypothetical protein